MLFQDKRQNREPERLEKVLDNVKEMNEKLIPESLKAMQVFLPDVSAKGMAKHKIACFTKENNSRAGKNIKKKEK